MTELLRPGITINEREGLPVIEGTSTSTGGFVGTAERGPLDEPVLITSFPQYVRRFGGFFPGSYLPHSVKAFFNEGGQRCWVVRVAEAGVKANGLTGSMDSEIQWTAVYDGSVGNSITVDLVDPMAMSSPLSVTVTGKDISVSLETDGGSMIISTANEVIAAIQADFDASELVTVAATGTGADVVAAEMITLSGGAGSSPARRVLYDNASTPAPTMRIEALTNGAFGNQIFLSNLKYSTALGGDLMTGATSATVVSTDGMQVGDIVEITDGTTTTVVVVLTINTTTKTITFPSVTLGMTISSTGSTVRSSTTHRVSTTTAGSLATGATELNLTNAVSVRKGMRLMFATATQTVTVVVNKVNGNTIFFDAVGTITTIPSGSLAVSLHFDLNLTEGGTVVESLKFLDLEENSQDFIEVRVNGDTNESLSVTLTDLDSASSAELTYPAPFNNILMADGEDGGTPTTTDFIGSASIPRSGLNLFQEGEIDQVNMISVPGITAVGLIQEGITLAESRQDAMFIFEGPQTSELPQEILEFRNATLNEDSSYAALYYPWVKTIDPEDADQIIQLPPSGWIQGEYANVAETRGLHKAPANVALRGILGLLHDTSDGEHDLLNPEGVNVIRNFRGRGIRIFGARTQSRRGDDTRFVNVRRVLNFIKTSLREGNQPFVFEPIDETLFNAIRVVNTRFLQGLVSQGALVPRNDPSQAFFVKVDSETTTAADIAAGVVNVEIGVSISKPAEFIVFNVSLLSGQDVSIQELGF